MSLSAIDRAQAAANSGDWSIVIELLQSQSIDQVHHSELSLDLAVQVLVNGDFDQQWQIGKIIPQLGEMAITPLLNLLVDQDYELEDRWVIARILGSFSYSQVITALIDLINHNEDAELTAIATGALTKIGVPAITSLTSLLTTSNRGMAIATLAKIRHSQTIEPLIQVIDDPDPQLRALVTEALGSFHDQRILPLLLTKLTDVAAPVRQAAVMAISLRSDRAIELNLSQHLRPLLFDLNLAVCQAAALGLSRFTADPDVVTMLLDVLKLPQTPDELQSSIILALGWIGTKPALDSLITAIGIPTLDGNQIPKIIIAIGKTEHEQVYASQVLVNYLQSGNQNSRSNFSKLTSIIKQEIATALGNLGNPTVVSDLVELLTDPDERVKLHALNAIAKLTQIS